MAEKPTNLDLIKAVSDLVEAYMVSNMGADEASKRLARTISEASL